MRTRFNFRWGSLLTLFLLGVLCALLPTAAAQAGSRAAAAPKITAASASYNTGVLRWSARGADHYEFELAGDAGFNSLLLGGLGHFQTRSTIATINRTLPDGKYWWRVRAVGKSGSISPWVTRTFTKAWRSPPQLVSPGDNASVSFPTQPLLLTWQPVLGAVTYQVTIAKDQALTSPISGSPATTTTTSYIPASTLADGRYFWAVTPLDAERHEGQRSAVRSFTWGWPSATQTNLRDLVDAPELDDPLLTWTPVAGAAKYEVDVNFSQDFNPSSKVCCSSTQVATGYSPTKILANNTYYWRVRPVNVQGSEGVWTQGSTFTKTFDTVPPVSGSSISGLHMRDASGDGGPRPAGWATSSPMLVWNPVPGASAYDLDVYSMSSSGCDITRTTGSEHWHVVTPLTAWSPLGTGHGALPYPSTGATFEGDGAKLVNGHHYCVRIRAEGDADTAGARIYGDYSYLNDAFSYVQPGLAGGNVGSPAGSYVTPAGGVTMGQTPIFTWHPIAGANSYWVLVSRDPSFTTLVLYAFTQLPEYVPRHTIADESTSYYWAVIPASGVNGSGVSVTPGGASPASFQKRSTPPTLISPTTGQELPAIQPQFQWSQVPGARNYRLQVSTDPQFGKLLDNVVTPSTSFVSNTTYPAQATLYWRVQVNDDQGTALTWSNPGTFKQVLPAPHPLADQGAGSSIPTWRWGAVQGAISYDVRVIVPGGNAKVYSGIPTPAFVPVQLSGIGLFRWQVRAHFSGSATGPYSALMSFRRTATPPKGLHVTASNGRTLLFSWTGRPGVRQYIVQVATDPAFSHGVDSETTEGTSVAPTLFQGGYAKGGLFYYHVAAIDADGNKGAYSPTKTFRFRGPSGH